MLTPVRCILKRYRPHPDTKEWDYWPCGKRLAESLDGLAIFWCSSCKRTVEIDTKILSML